MKKTSIALNAILLVAVAMLLVGYTKQSRELSARDEADKELAKISFADALEMAAADYSSREKRIAGLALLDANRFKWRDQMEDYLESFDAEQVEQAFNTGMSDDISANIERFEAELELYKFGACVEALGTSSGASRLSRLENSLYLYYRSSLYGDYHFYGGPRGQLITGHARYTMDFGPLPHAYIHKGSLQDSEALRRAVYGLLLDSHRHFRAKGYRVLLLYAYDFPWAKDLIHLLASAPPAIHERQEQYIRFDHRNHMDFWSSVEPVLSKEAFPEDSSSNELEDEDGHYHALVKILAERPRQHYENLMERADLKPSEKEGLSTWLKVAEKEGVWETETTP